MKLLYLSLQAVTQGQAAHAHVTEIVGGLRRRGWQVTLAAVNYRDASPSRWARVVEMLRVQLSVVGAVRRHDAVYVRWHFLSFPLALAAFLARRPVVQEVNGSFSDMVVAWPSLRYVKRIVESLMTWQLRTASSVVVVTSDLARWVSDVGGHDRVTVITNAADIDLFKPNRKEESAAVEVPERYVIFFGAFSPWQGINTMLQALNHPAWPRDVSLVLVGSGTEQSAVERAAANDPRVHYVGSVPYVELGTLIARSEGSLICKEGDFTATGLMPLKLFESMACGVPLIVTNFAGMADVVEQAKCGLIIEPEDPAALAAAVHEISSAAELRSRMGHRGRLWMERGHSWDARAEETHRHLCRFVRD